MEVLRRAKLKAFRPRKCSESGSSVMMTKGCRAFLIAGSGKPRHGHEKRRGSPKQRRGHKKQARAGGSEPGTTRGSATARAQKLRRGPAARPTRGHEALTQKARKFNTRKFCPNLDSDLETRGKHKELNRKLRAPTRRKARAREEPSPGPPASETDARPPGHQPRGGAPACPRFSCGQDCPT